MRIRPATTPINFHCNKGTLTTHEEADFGDTLVYFDNRGIANVLSLYRLGKKIKVTYDSTDRGGVFKVYTKQGVIEFMPTTTGLHVLNLKTNPEAAFLLVSSMTQTYFYHFLKNTKFMLSQCVTTMKISPANKLKEPKQRVDSWA